MTREARAHSEKNWGSTLASLKKLLDTEHGSPRSRAVTRSSWLRFERFKQAPRRG